MIIRISLYKSVMDLSLMVHGGDISDYSGLVGLGR